MRKLVFVAVLLLGFCAVSAAQDVPQFEVFGGWNIVLPKDVEEVDYLNGWEGSFGVNVNEYAGAVIDISGVYYNGNEEMGNVSIHSFLVGPQVKIPANEKIVPFVRALFGASHLDTEVNTLNDNGLTIAIGGGVDINYNDRISIRPAQVEYVASRFNGEFLDTGRFAAGIVFKFGER
jgi:opacity protein-like surface antigen